MLQSIKNDVSGLYTYLLKRDYCIVKRYFSLHITPQHNLQVVRKISRDELEACIQNKCVLRICTSRLSKFNFFRNRADYIDLFLLKKVNQTAIELCESDISIPLKDFLPDTKLSRASNMYLPNLRYKNFLPPKKREQVKDFEMLGLESN